MKRANCISLLSIRREFTGLLAYLHGEVVGWVAVEPRSAYPRLAHSRTLKPVDDQEVWSVTCFYVAKKFRRRGIAVELLKAAVEHVREQGGKIVEGYPVDAQTDISVGLDFHRDGLRIPAGGLSGSRASYSHTTDLSFQPRIAQCLFRIFVNLESG